MAKVWIFVFAAIAVVAVFIAVICFGANKINCTFSPLNKAFSNPFIGYAPMPGSLSKSAEDTSLCYIEVRWKDIEPEEGVFAWEEFEEKNKFQKLREKGMHIIMRFVCDIPEDEPHRDIPDWLYEKTADGTDYNTSYGCGYSPDYTNSTFIKAHKKAVEALGERYGKDTFVSYIQLGSLGHWGEWHVKYSDGICRLPYETTREEYVTPWIKAFPNAKILMRRPFTHAKEHGFGLYNDMTGCFDDTLEWLGWIENGGSYSQTGEENAVVPMPDVWQNAPIGGEFTSGTPMEQMLDTELEQTISLIRKSHMSFIGPKIADISEKEGFDEVLKNLGYKFRVEKAEISELFGTCTVLIKLKNAGTAPIYWDLPVCLYIESKDGEKKEQFDISLSKLMPGEETEMSVRFEEKNFVSRLKSGEIRLTLGITDPLTGKDSIRFDTDAGFENGRLVIFEK